MLTNICAVSGPKQSAACRAAEGEGGSSDTCMMRAKTKGHEAGSLQLTVPLAGASPLSVSSFSTSTSFFSFSSYKIKACENRQSH